MLRPHSSITIFNRTAWWRFIPYLSDYYLNQSELLASIRRDKKENFDDNFNMAVRSDGDRYPVNHDPAFKCPGSGGKYRDSYLER
jgi:hypothetical protein